MDKLYEITIKGVREFFCEIPEQTISQFETYYEFLIEQNRVMNLTTITDAEDCANLHFLDSLALFLVNDYKNARIIDIGSGAGFPGLPIKLAQPSANLTLLDATSKRVSFLSALCEKLEVSGVTCLHARAEEAANDSQHRDSYDFAFSRAVSRLNILCELCLPFVKPGGKFLAMKGVDSDTEIEESAHAVKTLGGAILPPIDYLVPNTEIRHRIVVIEKFSPTPDGYPRRFSRIQKSPL